MSIKEELYQLPDDWVWTTIGEIGIVQSGGTPSTRNKEFWGDEVSWITPADLSGYNEKYISKGNRSITKIGLAYSSAKLLPAGTVLFSSRAPIGYVVIAKNELATNQGFKNLIATKSLNSEYVYYYFQTLKPMAEKVANGTTFLELSAKNFSSLPFPLPPLKEQYKIVSKIETLFSELDQAEKGLQKAKQQLEVYRQALLKSAFDGKLTNPNIKSGYVPSSWKIVKISEISNVVRGGSPRPAGDPNFYDGKIPFLKVRDITKDRKAVLNTFEFTIKEAGLRKTRKIKPKTLLLSNSGATLGVPKICMIDATINDGIAAFLELDERSLFYIYYFFLSKTQKLRNINMGAAQPNLNTSIIKNIELPYCSFEEQNNIVEILESNFTLIENLEKSIKNSLNEVYIFKHSLLKKAFEGKLVNQDSNDESEKLLLQKIKKEKKEYLKVQKELDKLKPKKKRQMEKKKTIIEILKNADKPLKAKDLWQLSVHNDDIESFYRELKDVYHLISESKQSAESTESLLSIKK